MWLDGGMRNACFCMRCWEMGIRTEGGSVEWGRVGEGAKRVGI